MIVMAKRLWLIPLLCLALPVFAAWRTDSIADGLMLRSFDGVESTTGRHQSIRVLDLDTAVGGWNLRLLYDDKERHCSDAVTQAGGIAGINAGFEPEALDIRSGGVQLRNVEIAPNDRRWFMHQGQLAWNCLSDFSISRRDSSLASNYLTSGPLIIANHDAVGKGFVAPFLTDDELRRLHHHDLNNFAWTHHPRTIVAVTDSGHILLITIDGRFPQATGMSLAEVADFLIANFDIRDAINMDGGGSTTMVVKGYGDPETSVVNHPCDDGQFSHDNQRNLTSFLVLVKK